MKKVPLSEMSVGERLEYKRKHGPLRSGGLERRPVTSDDLESLKDSLRSMHFNGSYSRGNTDHFTVGSYRVADLIEELEDARKALQEVHDDGYDCEEKTEILVRIALGLPLGDEEE